MQSADLALGYLLYKAMGPWARRREYSASNQDIGQGMSIMNWLRWCAGVSRALNCGIPVWGWNITRINLKTSPVGCAIHVSYPDYIVWQAIEFREWVWIGCICALKVCTARNSKQMFTHKVWRVLSCELWCQENSKDAPHLAMDCCCVQHRRSSEHFLLEPNGQTAWNELGDFKSPLFNSADVVTLSSEQIYAWYRHFGAEIAVTVAGLHGWKANAHKPVTRPNR